MNEAVQTATEPIEEVLDAVDKISAYPLDQDEFDIPIKTNRGQMVYHKLAKPTLAELIEREKASSYETEAVSDTEEKISVDDEIPNARLWDKIALKVKGYKLSKADIHPIDEWRDLTPELRAAIPVGHKALAIRAMYQFTCEVEAEEDEGFTLAAETWTIKQTFGDAAMPDYIIRHVMKTPTEKQRRDFKARASEVRFSKGARKMRTKVLTNLKAHVELYDDLIVSISGVTTESAPTVGEFSKIDPIWKQMVIIALMRSFEASAAD